MQLAFDNSYARLPERFYARLAPTPVAAPRILKINHALAEALGIDGAALETAEGAEILAGVRVPEGAEPLAMAYAGHQFGGFSPQLGDGRAILLGEVIGRDGIRYDIQLKGSGPTPFSRMGDGRAAIGPVLREYIVSEAMAAMGIPTTRALAAVATGEAVRRETLLPGAVLTRVAQSHIRVGTFQFFAARRDGEALHLLTDHVISRHYPQAAGAERPALALLEAVSARQASLIAQWMSVGFIHGVMNTDNMSIAGETIDYGPCAFMDRYHPGTVFSSIDHGGRYAYGNQPRVAQWNLVRLAECLLPLIDADPDRAVALAQEVIDHFSALYRDAWLEIMRAKLGLAEAQDGDEALAVRFLKLMEDEGADFTASFRALATLEDDDAFLQRFSDGTRAQAQEFLAAWRARLAGEGRPEAERQAAMRRVNPVYIPRNHLVEEALEAATAGDLGPFETLLGVLAAPFDERSGLQRFAEGPKPGEEVLKTFCGT